MNKQIEKLALQAGMHRDKFGMYFAGDKHNEDGVDLEKFAELIVKESMKVTKDYTCNQGWDYSAPVALARHFGVEE